MNDPFPTTRWSLVVRAQRGDDSEARRALSALCSSYWYPLYAYVRRRGHSKEDAHDLVQGYFARVLEKRSFDGVQPDAGRFRAFLLHTMKQYLVNERERARALKRGGGVAPIRLDAEAAEGRYASILADAHTPEKEFDRQWALTLVDRVLERLRGEAERTGKLPQFEVLRHFLTDDAPSGTYRKAGETLGMTEGAVKVAVHRLRQRFGGSIRDEIAETVATQDDVEPEVRHLFDALTL